MDKQNPGCCFEHGHANIVKLCIPARLSSSKLVLGQVRSGRITNMWERDLQVESLLPELADTHYVSYYVMNRRTSRITELQYFIKLYPEQNMKE